MNTEELITKLRNENMRLGSEISKVTAENSRLWKLVEEQEKTIQGLCNEKPEVTFLNWGGVYIRTDTIDTIVDTAGGGCSVNRMQLGATALNVIDALQGSVVPVATAAAVMEQMSRTIRRSVGD